MPRRRPKGWPGPSRAGPASTGAQPGASADPSSPAVHAPSSGGMPPGPAHGMGPGRTWSPAPSPTPHVVVVRERRRGIGFLGVIVLLGLAVLAFGVAAATGATARPVAFGLASAVGVLGLGLFVVALLGRRAGGLATLGIAAALATALAVSIPASVSMSALGAGTGEPTWKPAEGASDPAYQLGAGKARLDLSGLSADGPDNQPVSAAVSLGELVVVVPPGLTVQVDAKVGARRDRPEGRFGDRLGRRAPERHGPARVGPGRVGPTRCRRHGGCRPGFADDRQPLRGAPMTTEPLATDTAGRSGRPAVATHRVAAQRGRRAAATTRHCRRLRGPTGCSPPSESC